MQGLDERVLHAFVVRVHEDLLHHVLAQVLDLRHGEQLLDERQPFLLALVHDVLHPPPAQQPLDQQHRVVVLLLDERGLRALPALKIPTSRPGS